VDKIKTNLSLDALTVVGTVHERAQKYLDYSRLVESSWITSKGMYHANYKLHGTGFIQISHYSDDVPKMRLDFNPNHVTGNIKKDFYPLFKLMHDAHITRLDVALDIYGLDLSTYQIHDEKSRKKSYYMNGVNRLETAYIGSRNSDRLIRVYDKGLEQKIGSDALWWRVEGQMRYEKARELVNPFDGLVMVKDVEVGDYDIRTRAMVEYLYNHPEAFAELSPNSRAKYKSMIMALGQKIEINFTELFNEKRYDLVDEVRSWVGLTDVARDTE